MNHSFAVSGPTVRDMNKTHKTNYPYVGVGLSSERIFRVARPTRVARIEF